MQAKVMEAYAYGALIELRPLRDQSIKYKETIVTETSIKIKTDQYHVRGQLFVTTVAKF